MEKLTEKLIIDIQQGSAGEPYPVYVQNLKEAGIESYEVSLTEPGITFFSVNGDRVTIKKETPSLKCSDKLSVEGVKEALKRVQQGLTDYNNFLTEIAASGVCAYRANLSDMKIEYKGKKPGESFMEKISAPDK